MYDYLNLSYSQPINFVPWHNGPYSQHTKVHFSLLRRSSSIAKANGCCQSCCGPTRPLVRPETPTQIIWLVDFLIFILKLQQIYAKFDLAQQKLFFVFILCFQTKKSLNVRSHEMLSISVITSKRKTIQVSNTPQTQNNSFGIF